MSAPFISVVIPVYRDAENLARCLAALAGQTYPADSFEILVADNEPDAGPSRYAGVSAPPARVRVLKEPKPGAYAARNRGVHESKGELLAFTDSDCVPAPTWLEEGARRWRQLPPESVVAGRIDLHRSGPVPHAAEIFDEMFLGFPQDTFARRDHFSATANMFCGRAAFERAGVFDEALFSAGDYEWGRRAHALGVGVYFEPAAVVAHPARASLRSIFMKIRRQAGGAWIVKSRMSPPPTLRQRLATELVRWKQMRAALRPSPEPGFGARRWKLLALASLLQGVRAAETLRLAAGGRPARR